MFCFVWKLINQIWKASLNVIEETWLSLKLKNNIFCFFTGVKNKIVFFHRKLSKYQKSAGEWHRRAGIIGRNQPLQWVWVWQCSGNVTVSICTARVSRLWHKTPACSLTVSIRGNLGSCISVIILTWVIANLPQYSTKHFNHRFFI